MEGPLISPEAVEGRRNAARLLKATKPYTVERRARSWFDVLSTFTILGALITTAAWPLPWYGRVAAGFLAGLVAVRAFVLYHDYQHGAILRRSRVARLLMPLYGLLTLNPPSPWNRSHNHHHQNNSQILGSGIGSFPIMTREAYLRAGRGQRLRYAAARHPLTLVFGYLTVFLVGMTLRPLILDPRRHPDCAAALLLHGLLIGALAWLDPMSLLLAMLLPLFVASMLGAYLFYAQHNFPGMRLRPRADWDYVGAAVESTSLMKLGPLLAWITADIGIHPVHHLNPRIPHYRLEEALESLEELRAAGRTGLTVREIWSCLRLKLWDAERQRMVTFRGEP